MSSHVHPPGTPTASERDWFLVDGCERCAEFVADLGLDFDADRFRAFWVKMVEVEYDDVGGYGSDFDKALGRKLYFVSLVLQRAFGIDPRTIGAGQAPLSPQEVGLAISGVALLFSQSPTIEAAALLRKLAEIEAAA